MASKCIKCSFTNIGLKGSSFSLQARQNFIFFIQIKREGILYSFHNR